MNLIAESIWIRCFVLLFIPRKQCLNKFDKKDGTLLFLKTIIMQLGSTSGNL